MIDLITVAEAATLVNRTPVTVYSWVREGKLARWGRRGRAVLVLRSAVLEVAASLPDKGKTGGRKHCEATDADLDALVKERRATMPR